MNLVKFGGHERDSSHLFGMTNDAIGKPYLPIPSPLTRGIPQKSRLEGKFARFQRILNPKMAQFARFRYIARQWEIQG